MAVNNLNTGVGIQPTIVDAKGDLIAATANDAVNRLAVGTNGHVLVADSGETTGLKWNNPGSVGGLVHINSTTFSSSNGESVNNVFSSSHNNYKIILKAVASVNMSLSIRLRVAGVDNSVSNSYIRQTLNADATGVSAARVTSTLWSGVLPVNSSNGNNSTIILTSPFLAEVTGFNNRSTSSAGGAFITLSGGSHNQTVSFDGFSIFPDGGTFSGTVQIFGFKD